MSITLEADAGHSRYLSAALAADVASLPQFGHFVETWTDTCSGWAGIIEEIVSLAEVLHQARLDALVDWGETHDQYDTLDALARQFLAAELPLTPDARVLMVQAALKAGAIDGQGRQFAQIDRPSVDVEGRDEGRAGQRASSDDRVG